MEKMKIYALQCMCISKKLPRQIEATFIGTTETDLFPRLKNMLNLSTSLSEIITEIVAKFSS
jgi:hypothetical protein